LLEIADAWEILLFVDDASPLTAKVEAREDDRLGGCDVEVHDRRAGRCADEPPDLVAYGQREVPPALAPGAGAAGVPARRVLRNAVLGLDRHRPEGVADQVRGLREDREPVAVVGELHAA
jgi:hypothetical protein